MLDRFICLDVEMPNGDGNRISAIGITVFENGEVTQRIYSLINPETRFQPYVVKLIGITPEMVEDKPNFAEYWENIKDVLSSGILVAHGAGNDLKALSDCLRDYNIDWLQEIKYICTVEACSKTYPDRQLYSLNTLCDEFGIELDHHYALSDSEACGRLLLKCFEDGFEEENFIKIFDLEAGHQKRTRKPKISPLAPSSATSSVREDLFALATPKTKRNFLKKNPRFREEQIIGVCDQTLYAYYYGNASQEKLNLFTSQLPHDYHEENRLHAIIISNTRKFAAAMQQLDEFLPYVDDAATCALLRPGAFANHQDKAVPKLIKWVTSDEKYAVIFALNVIAKRYLWAKQQNLFLEIVASVKRDDPEIKQAVKNYYARALGKIPKKAVKFIRSSKIDDIADDVIGLALSRYAAKDKIRERIETLQKERKEVVTA